MRTHADPYRKLRAVIYARISTEKQDSNTSLLTQIAESGKLSDENGYVILLTLDEIFTGMLYRERPKLSQLREMVRNGEVDVIIFYAFDRLSRDDVHLTILMEEFEYCGVKIECVTEKFDDTSAGRLLRSIQGYVAKDEHRKIVLRMKTGKRARAEDGFLMPSNRPLYGYSWESRTTIRKGKEVILERAAYVINPPQAEVVERIHQMYVSGWAIRAIAAKLTQEGIPSPSGQSHWTEIAVRRILHNKFYAGKGAAFVHDWTGGRNNALIRSEEEQVHLPEGIVPAIINEDVYNQIQEKLRLNKLEAARHNPNPEETLLRCGFIRCGYCGNLLSVQRNESRGVLNYFCKGSHRVVKVCKGTKIKVSTTDDAVWAFVGETIQELELVQKALQYWRRKDPTVFELKPIETSIKKIKGTQEALTADLRVVDEDGQPKLKGRSRDLHLNDLAKLEENLQNLEEERQKVLEDRVTFNEVQEEVDNFLEWCLTAKESYPNASYKDKRRALKILGIIVMVYRSDDEEHERYQINIRVPDIVRRRSK
ncbi:MAG: recombinase family protein [Methanosarcina thermophila]